MDTPKCLFLFVGRTGSGKETQGRLLAEKLGATMFMTGGRFREILAKDDFLAERIKEDYEKGLLMPSWFAVYLFQEFLLKLPPMTHGVCEGTGRSEHEARYVEEVTTWLKRPYTVFNLEVSEESVIKRSLLRKRADGLDKDESIIRTRLEEYRKTTLPAIEYFKSVGKLINIDGEPAVEAIHAAVMMHVGKLG
jgi:adenylate kinase